MNSKLLSGLAAIAMAAMLLPGVSTAASFDCAKASTVVEKLICDSPTLGKLDEELARLYQRELKWYLPAERPRVREKQQRWLKEERDRCTTVDCVAMELYGRASQFRSGLERSGTNVDDIPLTAPHMQAVEKMLASEKRTK